MCLINKLFFSLFFLLFLNFPSYSLGSAIAPASIEWAQLDTEHFHIIYDKAQQDLGLYYAQIAEQAYSNLNTIFVTLPEKTTLVVNDSTDVSNGNATVFPYPLIYAYPVLVGQQESLSEAGEWAKELITHELTHVAQLYPYNGTGYKIARALFGSIISPNLLTPLWWKEGMAVEMETQFSPRGRTRSYLQDAQVRSYVTSKTFLNYDLAQANEALVTWPYGNRPYFFGSMIMSEISKNSANATGQVVQNQATLPPYFVNTAVENVLNKNYKQIYTEAQNDYLKNSETQISTLNSIPVPASEKINPNLLQSKSAQYSETHGLLGLIATNDMKTVLELYQRDPNNKNFKKLERDHAPTGSISQFSFHPTRREIIFSKAHKTSSTQMYSDLFIYNIDEDKVDDLTENLRGRDPVYSPNGLNALFIGTAHGQTELKQIEIATKKISSILLSPLDQRINSYAYIDDQNIVYTLRTSVGDQELYHLNLSTLKPEKITTDAPQIRFIKYKNQTLFFTSTANEVMNVYSAQIKNSKLASVQPLSHLITGTQSFDVDTQNKKVFATQITEIGPAVTASDYVPEGTKLPLIKNEILSRYNMRPNENFSKKYESTEYSSWPYLWPQYWIPFISTNITGDGVLYQALTSASDPLGYHNYAAQLNYDSYSQKIGYVFSYTNTTLSTAWNLSAIQTQQLLGLSNYVRKNTYSLSLIPDVFSWNEDLRLSLGVLLPQTEYANANTNHLGGYIQASVTSVEQKPQHYHPMTGYSLLARYSSLKDQNNQTNPLYGDYSQAQLSFTSYNHLFFPKDHTLMIKMDGLYTFNDVANRFGTSNLSLPSYNDLTPQYLIRGYQAGQFLGTQMGTLNVEYRFPIIDLSFGSRTAPFFMKYITAGVVADVLKAKGFAYDKNDTAQVIKLEDTFSSAGLEARLSTTVGYILPVDFIYGVYFPSNTDYTEDKVVNALTLQISGF